MNNLHTQNMQKAIDKLEAENVRLREEIATRPVAHADWPMEVQPDGTVTPVDPVDFFAADRAARPVADAGEAVATYQPGTWFDARTLDEMQAFYRSRLPAIRAAAQEHGYAIGVHGSERRDFDLMAMQWRDNASDKDTLARAIADAACGIRREGVYEWEQKPDGRVAVSIPICWTVCDNPDFDKPSVGHVDLSLIDRAAPSARMLSDVIVALKRLEDANDKLCALRTRDQYLSMIDGGQQDALYELDSARMAARAIIAATSTASEPAAPTLPDNGIEHAAKHIEQKAEDYINEHASNEPDTGAVSWHYGEAGSDYYNGLVELAEEIRLLAATSAQAGDGVVRDAAEPLSALLWLYRRLPRSYGRQPHIESAITALAAKAGAEVGEFLAERCPAAITAASTAKGDGDD